MALVPSTSVGGSGGATEIGYDQITANVTVASTTEATGTTVIACAAHTFDGAAVIATFFGLLAPATGGSLTISLFEGATQIGRLVTLFNSATVGENVSQTGILRFTPTAGAHTYTVTGFRTVNNGVVAAGAGGTGVESPTFIRFTTAA